MKAKRVWLVTVGEPLPMDGDNIRLMRCGLLRKALVESGRETEWFISDFSHFNKRHRFGRNHTYQDSEGTVHLLHGCGYRRNVSISRIIDHRTIAKIFLEKTKELQPPDIILCSMPTIELSAACATYCQLHGIPLVIDIRDLWPDIFAKEVPQPFRLFAQLALIPYNRMLRRSLQMADALWAVSPGYLDWGLKKCSRSIGSNDRVHFLGYPDPGYAQISRAAACARMNLPEDTGSFTAWFIGSWGRTYDIGLIVEAARILVNTTPKIRIVISGDGEQRDHIRAAAAGLPNVYFTGWADSGAIASLMALSDVGLATYAAGAPQSIPNKVIEYLAGGLPVISTLSGECAQFLSSHSLGWTLPAGNPTNLANKLRELAELSDLLTVQKRCRDYFNNHLSASVVYPRMVEDLEKLTNVPAQRKQSV